YQQCQRLSTPQFIV
ncbi:hypothetical protein, partial [Enterobacter chuandaensis]